VKVRIRVSRVEMNAKYGALDTRILTTEDPCAVFRKYRRERVLTKPTLSYTALRWSKLVRDDFMEGLLGVG